MNSSPIHPILLQPRRSFEAPYNGCDRRCERCTLCDACVVGRRQALRDDELDSWADVPITRDADMDLVSPQPLPPSHVDVEPLRRAAVQLVRRLSELERDADHECMHLGVLLLAKTARVTSYLEDRFADAWAGDAVPNLILIEVTLTRLRECLAQETGSVDAIARVQQLLAPLLACIDEPARAQLATLVRAGRAPSPHLVTTRE